MRLSTLYYVYVYNYVYKYNYIYAHFIIDIMWVQWYIVYADVYVHTHPYAYVYVYVDVYVYADKRRTFNGYCCCCL